MIELAFSQKERLTKVTFQTKPISVTQCHQCLRVYAFEAPMDYELQSEKLSFLLSLFFTEEQLRYFLAAICFPLK